MQRLVFVAEYEKLSNYTKTKTNFVKQTTHLFFEKIRDKAEIQVWVLSALFCNLCYEIIFKTHSKNH